MLTGFSEILLELNDCVKRYVIFINIDVFAIQSNHPSLICEHITDWYTTLNLLQRNLCIITRTGVDLMFLKFLSFEKYRKIVTIPLFLVCYCFPVEALQQFSVKNK